MASGLYEGTNWDGTAFTEDQALMRDKAGQALQMRMLLLHIQGDWAEYCERMGFPTWQSGLRPCFLCAAPPYGLHHLTGLSPLGLPYHVNTDDDYHAACEKCEIKVIITAERQNLIRPLLFYDKRKQGACGRALRRAVPSLGLQAGDRLEPSHELPDVGAFGMLVLLPLVVTFWRASQETICKHRNPLVDSQLGITVTRCMAY